MRFKPSIRPHTNSRGWMCQTPAKINLFLEVLDKRPDGYHNLDTVMVAINLTDCIEIYPSDSDELTLELDLSETQKVRNQDLDQHDQTWQIPTSATGPGSNLVLRALDALRTNVGTKPGAKPNTRAGNLTNRSTRHNAQSKSRGAHVILKKRIPSQAGLGGGSSDAAAALVLGTLLWELPYDPDLLGSIASQLGSDINFFLDGYNGRNWTARCTRRGELVEPVANTCQIHGVVVHPPLGCPTAQVFSNVRDSIAQRERAHSPDAILECLGDESESPNRAARLGQLLYNRLDDAAMQTTEWVEKTAHGIARYDVLGQCLSGSGSARYCLCAHRTLAESIASDLYREGNFRAFPFTTWTSPSIREQIMEIR